jgi:uncharacterized metal-binding protein
MNIVNVLSFYHLPLVKYTDNVRFNHKLNVIAFGGALALFLSQHCNLVDGLLRSLYFVAIYMLASAYIQPDLDQTVQRPGKTTFPLGQFKNTKMGENLATLLFPINRIWYYLWQPYGSLLTHRGIGHWPIIGTWTRAIYLLGILFILNHLIPIINTFYLSHYLNLFFPTEANRLNWDSISLFWFTYILPVFFADSVHFLVDLFDAIRNNTRFASYAHEPGILKRMLNPKIMKYHKRALKKAKSNSKKRAKAP